MARRFEQVDYPSSGVGGIAGVRELKSPVCGRQGKIGDRVGLSHRGLGMDGRLVIRLAIRLGWSLPTVYLHHHASRHLQAAFNILIRNIYNNVISIYIART